MNEDESSENIRFGETIYKFLFFWPYRAAQSLVRLLVILKIGLVQFLLGISLALAVVLILDWRGYILGFRGATGLLSFILFIWFILYFEVACLCFERKLKKIQTSIDSLSRKSASDLIGLDLISIKAFSSKDLLEDWPLEVIGGEEILRNLLQSFLETDAKKNCSIIILAPQGEKNLLEEVTYILRERRKEETRSFFYYSLNHPKLSVTYSPFFGNGTLGLLESWFDLDDRGDEWKVLNQLVSGLQDLKRPFELNDLLILLTDKSAAFAISESQYIRDYLMEFDALNKARRSLAEKLTKFGKYLKLSQYPLFRGFPLDLSDMFESHKHLYIELENEATALTKFFLFDLNQKINNRYRYQNFETEVPRIYLIHPEKLENVYSIKQYVNNIGSSCVLRVFSKNWNFSNPWYWNTIVAPGSVFTEEAKLSREHFHKEIEAERKRLKRNLELKAVLNEETFEAISCFMQKINLKTAFGIFQYPRRGIGTEPRCHQLFIPSKPRPKLEYEPYQKRYKAEDMLNLGDRIRRAKIKNPTYDLGVIDIIQDLKPKNQDSSKEVC